MKHTASVSVLTVLAFASSGLAHVYGSMTLAECPCTTKTLLPRDAPASTAASELKATMQTLMSSPTEAPPASAISSIPVLDEDVLAELLKEADEGKDSDKAHVKVEQIIANTTSGDRNHSLYEATMADGKVNITRVSIDVDDTPDDSPLEARADAAMSNGRLSRPPPRAKFQARDAANAQAPLSSMNTAQASKFNDAIGTIVPAYYSALQTAIEQDGKPEPTDAAYSSAKHEFDIESTLPAILQTAWSRGPKYVWSAYHETANNIASSIRQDTSLFDPTVITGTSTNFKIHSTPAYISTETEIYYPVSTITPPTPSIESIAHINIDSTATVTVGTTVTADPTATATQSVPLLDSKNSSQARASLVRVDLAVVGTALAGILFALVML